MIGIIFLFQLYAMHWSVTEISSCVETTSEHSSRVLYAADYENYGRKELQNQSGYLEKNSDKLKGTVKTVRSVLVSSTAIFTYIFLILLML